MSDLPKWLAKKRDELSELNTWTHSSDSCFRSGFHACYAEIKGDPMLTLIRAQDKKMEEMQKRMDHGEPTDDDATLGHSCKHTCSGWSNGHKLGYQLGHKEMQEREKISHENLVEQMRRERKLVEALKVICDWMVPDARKVQKARDTLKELGIE